MQATKLATVWPASVAGPTNLQKPKSLSNFIEMYMRHLHVVIVDDQRVGFLQPFVTPGAASEDKWRNYNQVMSQIRSFRQAALDALLDTIDDIEPSKTRATHYKVIVRQWFTDLE